MNRIVMVPLPARTVVGRWHYAGLAVLFLAFAVYGSLVPFHYHPLSFGEALARFRVVLAQPIGVQSRSDWVANILLFLPLGFLLMGAGCCDRPWLGVPIFLLVAALCIPLSGAIEFTQLYFPSRVSSINDIAAESLGGSLGALFWLARGQWLTMVARRLWTQTDARGTAALLLPCYLAFVLVISVLPFDFTISPADLWHKYKEGRVHLMPFASGGVGLVERINKYFWNVALFVPVGVLLGYLPGRIGGSSRSWPRILGLGLLIAGTIELAQLFVLSRYCDITDVLTGGPAILAGWAIALFHHRRQAPVSGRRGTTEPYSRVRWSLLVVWLAVLIFMEWQPFNFSLNLRGALNRLRHVSPLPFLDYYRGDYLGALDDFVHKVLLFLPLGALLAPPPSARVWSRVGLFGWLLATGLAVVLEAGQLFLPTRYASLTDVLVGSLAACLGLLLVHRLRAALPWQEKIPSRFGAKAGL
jgi:glycopeptide antibiotics resistance protein